jgi:hypothetical protein
MKSGGKVESKIEGNDPDAKLHALIEARRKELQAAKGGGIFGTTEPKPIGFDKGGAAFGVFPQLKGKRSKQDPEAAKNVPVDVARGVVSGVLGAPGDIESLLRIPYDYLRSPTMSELVTGEKKSKTFIPTSEDIEKKLPFKSDTPVSRAATGAGQLAGGFYYGPGSPLKVIANLPGAVKHGATEFAKASAAGAPRVIKQEGGNWMKGTLDTDLRPLKRNTAGGNDTSEVLQQMKERYTPEVLDGMQENSRRNILEQMDTLEKMDALNKWVDGNLKNYVKKQMGTPSDPVRKLAEEGIVHMPTNEVGINRYTAPTHRKILGGEQLGQSDAAKAWEDAADVAITPTKIKDLPNEYREYWMESASPDTIVSHLNRNFDINGLGFDHIMDVLRQDLVSGRIRPEQLNKVSMEQAVRRTAEYDQEMAKQMRETALKQTEGFPIHKEYPEGYKWLELSLPPDKVLPEGHSIVRNKGVSLDSDDAYLLKDATGKVIGFGESEADIVRNLSNTNNSEGYKKLKDALDYEGKAMGHCVGSYCDEVSGGNTKIYTLRDAKGEPHVTIEVEPGHGEQSMEAAEERFKKARATDPKNTPKNFIDWAEDNDVAFDADTFRNPSIIQIKGKQNRAPKEEYLPYVQDFVKSGQWTGIGDLKNTGLKTIDEAFPNYEDAKYFANTNPNAKYVTQAEIDAQRKQINEELINEFGSHRIKPDPQSKTTYGRTDFMTAKELAELEFPGDLERQANMIRGAMQGTTEPGAFSGTIYPPLAEKSGGLIGMANGGAMRVPPKKTEGYEEEAPKGQSFSDRLDWAMKEARKVPTSPLGSFLNVGYEGYKYFTGKDPVGDFQKELNRRLNSKIDTGSEPIEKFEKFANGGVPSMQDTLKNIQNYSVLNQGAPKKPNELGGVILAGASWLAGDEKTKLAKQAFGQDVTNTAIGGQKTSDVLNQLNVFQRDGGTFAPNTTVVLDIGANDIAQGVDEATIRANLNEIVSRLGDEGVQVILSGQPEAHSYEEAINRTDLQMDDLYQDIAANNPNVTLVDAMSGFLNQKDLMDESRFHLNTDDAKLAYLNKFADAYKGLDTPSQEVVDTSEKTQTQQVVDPIKQDFKEAISQVESPVVDMKVVDPIKEEFQEVIGQTEIPAVNYDPPQIKEVERQPSSGYSYAEQNQGLDSYYQAINDFLSQERTQDEIQAAMEQYGVSQADVDAARGSGIGKLDESYATAQYNRGGSIRMAPGGLIRNLLKMSPKEEALSKLPQMKKEVAANQALEAEYRKAMRDVPYDKQVTLKDWQASQKKPAKKTVWHGSPHHFKPTEKNPLGVFDPTKIGTGEGTQAFGHGHYLAEAKGNAEGYRHMLSVDPSQGSENIKYATLENFMPNEAPAVQKQIKDFLDGTGNYADFVRVIKQQGSEDFKKALVSEEPEMFKAGALYQVELPEEQLANMLDYDLPWTQQPEAVKKALNVEGLQKFYNSDDLPVSQILHHAHQSMTPPQFAEFMRSRGIPGIKYKDAQSRGIREAEEGTRNIVIFPGNEDLLNIVGKEKRGGLIHTRKQYA